MRHGAGRQAGDLVDQGDLLGEGLPEDVEERDGAGARLDVVPVALVEGTAHVGQIDVEPDVEEGVGRRLGRREHRHLAAAGEMRIERRLHPPQGRAHAGQVQADDFDRDLVRIADPPPEHHLADHRNHLGGTGVDRDLEGDGDVQDVGPGGGQLGAQRPGREEQTEDRRDCKTPGGAGPGGEGPGREAATAYGGSRTHGGFSRMAFE